MYNPPPEGHQFYPNQQQSGFMAYPPPPGDGYRQNEMPPQPPPVFPRPWGGKDNEQGGVGGSQWGDFTGLESKEIRRMFIRKVYSILMVQLAITFGLIALFHFIPSVHNYVRSSNGQWLYWTSYVVFFVVYMALICSRRAARNYPLNLILLGILTLSMGYMVRLDLKII
ncbi:unnamed protein product [Rotaria sp. Silwood1]|nr:unnamed protein product [Rotaria sp. Silwood1]CAF1656284.1 unnamed protein product [Rotaria sp. Silwood1]